MSLRSGSSSKKSFFPRSSMGGFFPIIPLRRGTLSGSCAYLEGIASSLHSHNESPRCSASYKRPLSLGLSLVGPYSPRGSSSPIATLEPEPLDDPSPHPCCLAELVVNFSLRCARRENHLAAITSLGFLLALSSYLKMYPTIEKVQEPHSFFN